MERDCQRNFYPGMKVPILPHSNPQQPRVFLEAISSVIVFCTLSCTMLASACRSSTPEIISLCFAARRYNGTILSPIDTPCNGLTPLKTTRFLYLISPLHEVLILLCFLTTATSLASLNRERDDAIPTYVDLRVQRGAPKYLASGFIDGISEASGQIPDHPHANVGFNYSRAVCAQGKVSCSRG